MRLIDGNKIVMSLADWWYSSFRQEETEESKAIKKVMNQVEKMVMEMPEIVRCKDCRHRDLFSCPLVDNDFQKDEDFCSWGECKEEKQVTGKLNNPDDSLLTEDSEACKEQKSKLESEKVQLSPETSTTSKTETVDTPTDTSTNTPTDLISRQAAIEAMAPFDTNHELRDTLEGLPSVEDMGEVSDGYHTFNQLYHQRAVLFATIVNQNKDKAWKSWKHEDGKFCFDKGGEWFIVGVDTPEGSYTYHYEKKYWDLFDCEELDRGKHWDGHTEEDVTRLLSLPPVEPTHKAICEHFYKGYCSRFEDGCFWQCQKEQERPKGEWIDMSDGGRIKYIWYEKYMCNKCGERGTSAWSFCPNCGADMRGDKDE